MKRRYYGFEGWIPDPIDIILFSLGLAARWLYTELRNSIPTMVKLTIWPIYALFLPALTTEKVLYKHRPRKRSGEWDWDLFPYLTENSLIDLCDSILNLAFNTHVKITHPSQDAVVELADNGSSKCSLCRWSIP